MKKPQKFFLLLTLILLFTISLRRVYFSNIHDNDRHLIAQLYYENEEKAFFCSSNSFYIINDIINPYSVYWLSKCNDIMKIDNNLISDTIRNYYKFKNEKIDSLKDINELQILYYNLVLEKKYLKKIKNKKYYINLLYNSFVENKWSYKKDDTYNEMINKTQILYFLLLNFNELECIPVDINDNLVNYISMYINNSNFFNNNNDLTKNLCEEDIIMLKMLIILNKHNNNNLNIIINSKKNWILQQNQLVNSFMKNEVQNKLLFNEILCNLNQINAYFNIDNNFINKYSPFSNSEVAKKMYFSDPHSFYKALKSDIIIGNSIKYKMKNFITNNQKFWLYKEIPDINLEETYYGIKLAKIYDIKYNSIKLNNLIDKYNNIKSINNIFYFVLIKSELNTDVNISKDMMTIIANNISNFQELSYENKFKLIYLYKFFDLKILSFNDVLKQLNFQDEISKSSYDNDLFYLIKTLNFLKIEIESEIIKKYINLYKLENGSYTTLPNCNNGNIYSTYRMLNLIIDNHINISSNNKKMISKYIKTLKGKKGGYFMYNEMKKSSLDYKENFTLKSFYYGIEIDRLLKSNN